jgi:hypothetical protein
MPKKVPAKRAPRHAPPDPDPVVEPDWSSDGALFVIEPVIKRYRYMFAGGRIMDVSSPYQSNSTDREKVLIEAQRRWGGKKDDWRIEGSTELRDG